MNTVGIRAADSAASDSARSSGKRQQSPDGFDDAITAAGDKTGKPAKADAAADERGAGRSGGALSWDPRMKDAGASGNGKDAEPATGETEGAGVAGGHVVADEMMNAVDDDTPDDAPEGKGNDKKHDDEPPAAAVVIVAPVPAVATAIRAADSASQETALRPSTKPGLLPAATAKAAEQAGEPAPAATRTLAAQPGTGQSKGSSALAAFGSKLSELGPDAPRDGADRKPAIGQGVVRNGKAPDQAHGAGDGSKAHDEGAATSKTDAPDGLAALRLPAGPAAGGRNTSAIAVAAASDPAWARALAAEGTAGAQRAAQPGAVNALRIQLHPADLGVVTATLRLEGQHLVINLKVETAAAYRQLSADNRAIVDKLKGHGYVVESIAVQHVPVDRTASPQPQQGPGFANHQQGGGQQPMPNGGGQRFDQGGGGNGSGSHSSREPATTTREAVAPAGSSDPRSGGLYL